MVFCSHMDGSVRFWLERTNSRAPSQMLASMVSTFVSCLQACSSLGFLVAGAVVLVGHCLWRRWSGDRRDRAVASWEKLTSKLIKICRCPHPRSSLSRSKIGSNQHYTRYICRRCAQKVHIPVTAPEMAPKLVSFRIHDLEVELLKI